MLIQLSMTQQRIDQQSMFFYLNYMGEKVYISEEEYNKRQMSKVSSPGMQ
jgi:hypothetical protein